MKIPAAWLTDRVEEPPTTYHPALAGDALRIRMAWQKLRGEAMHGDELWAWATPPGQGRVGGFALVREGEVFRSVRVTG